jgi:regulatory protein
MIDPQEFLRQHPVVIPENSDEHSSHEHSPERTEKSARRLSKARSDVERRREWMKDSHSTHSKETDQHDLDDDEFARCQEAALRSLDAAGASTEGLRHRLSRKSFSPEVIDRVLHELQHEGVLNDSDYAQSIYERGLQKGLGSFGMRREMRLKGIPESIIDRFIVQGQNDGEFDQAAYDLADSVLRRSQNIDGQKLISRLVSAARRKGQSVSLVVKYAKELSADEGQL